MITIDSATLDDLPDLLELCKDFHRESPYSSLPFDPEVIEDTLRSCIGEEDSLLILLLKDNKIVGALAATIKNFLATVEPMAIEIFLYLKPEIRRNKKNTILLDAYHEWAKSKDLKIMYGGSFAGSPLGKYYKKNGYVKTEESYIKWLQ